MMTDDDYDRLVDLRHVDYRWQVYAAERDVFGTDVAYQLVPTRRCDDVTFGTEVNFPCGKTGSERHIMHRGRGDESVGWYHTKRVWNEDALRREQDVREFVDTVRDHPAWKGTRERWGVHLGRVSKYDERYPAGAWTRSWGADWHRITVRPRHRLPWIVLHELTHAVVPGPHTQTFAEEMTNLVRAIFGDDKADELAEAYQARHVGSGVAQCEHCAEGVYVCAYDEDDYD